MRLFILSILLFIIHIVCFAQNSFKSRVIERADSLYNINKLDQAMNLYLQVFNTTKLYSQHMMLRMAMISDYNGNVAEQLFYLSTLYRHRPSKKLLNKIEELSEEYNLQGYSYSDIEYFISVYKQHYEQILIFLIFCSLLFCIYLIIKKLKYKKLGYRPVLFLLFLAFLYTISNYSLIPPRAIIKNNKCLLMDEPSAASQLMAIANMGHRITLLGKKDIWYLVGWEGNSYYIKETDLLIIPESQPYLF